MHLNERVIRGRQGRSIPLTRHAISSRREDRDANRWNVAIGQQKKATAHTETSENVRTISLQFEFECTSGLVGSRCSRSLATTQSHNDRDSLMRIVLLCTLREPFASIEENLEDNNNSSELDSRADRMARRVFSSSRTHAHAASGRRRTRMTAKKEVQRARGGRDA